VGSFLPGAACGKWWVVLQACMVVGVGWLEGKNRGGGGHCPAWHIWAGRGGGQKARQVAQVLF